MHYVTQEEHTNQNNTKRLGDIVNRATEQRQTGFSFFVCKGLMSLAEDTVVAEADDDMGAADATVTATVAPSLFALCLLYLATSLSRLNLRSAAETLSQGQTAQR